MPSCLALLLTLFLSPQTEQPALTIHVTTEGRPVSNARVSAAGLTGRTDARGQVTLPLTAVPTDVMVDAEGFLTATVHVTALRQKIEVSLEPLP